MVTKEYFTKDLKEKCVSELNQSLSFKYFTFLCFSTVAILISLQTEDAS